LGYIKKKGEEKTSTAWRLPKKGCDEPKHPHQLHQPEQSLSLRLQMLVAREKPSVDEFSHNPTAHIRRNQNKGFFAHGPQKSQASIGLPEQEEKVSFRSAV
jgi:hypothetical protein